jgi:hypothetical protein
MDYWLTLFHRAATDAIQASSGDIRLVAFGHCQTKLDEDGDEIELGCEKNGAAPTCITLTLANPANGIHNPDNVVCDPDYAPYSAHIFPDSLSQFGGAMAFGDANGLTRYPVDAAQAAVAQVVLKSFSPAAHFVRRLVIPEIRLKEWMPNEGRSGSRAQ